MRIKTVGYQRVFNLGNYESLRIELHAEINEGEDVQATIDELSKEAAKWITSKGLKK